MIVVVVFCVFVLNPGFDGLQGRYSVVGAKPTMEIVAKEDKVTIMDHESGHLTEEIVDDPMAIPRRISQDWRPCLSDELPNAFCGKSSMI